MRQRQPSLRDGRSPQVERQVAYHEAFHRRLESLHGGGAARQVHQGPRPHPNDTALSTILRQLEVALEADGTDPTTHQATSEHQVTHASHSGFQAKLVGHHAHLHQAIHHASHHSHSIDTPVLSSPPPPQTVHTGHTEAYRHQSALVPSEPTHINQRLEWYRNYVGWVMYYRACALHYKALADSTASDESLLYTTK